MLNTPDGHNVHTEYCMAWQHQGSGGNQASHLCDQLRNLGCQVWYDNGVSRSDRTLAGMQRGVRESVTFLILLTGRRETKGRPDKDGEYEGVFTRVSNPSPHRTAPHRAG
jgi:hypothetical protein